MSVYLRLKEDACERGDHHHSTHVHAGPETGMVYALLPAGSPIGGKDIEPLLIMKLREEGFPLSSDHDAGKGAAA